MKRIVRLTEFDLVQIVKRVISEQSEQSLLDPMSVFDNCETEMDNMVKLIGKNNIPQSCFANVDLKTFELETSKCIEDLTTLSDKLEADSELIKLRSIDQLVACHRKGLGSAWNWLEQY
jgi:hypothetical protein